jgi:hypothetical protein
LLRRRFNDAGGDIGHLDDWGMPQHHSMEKVGKVSKDKWVSDIIGKLDRKYYTKSDGQLMSDAELTAFLGEAYETIATGGLNKLSDTGLRISGARANREMLPGRSISKMVRRTLNTSVSMATVRCGKLWCIIWKASAKILRW